MMEWLNPLAAKALRLKNGRPSGKIKANCSWLVGMRDAGC
jgi:hypothetical protein